MSHAEQAKSPTGLTDEQWQIPRKLLPTSSASGCAGPGRLGSGGWLARGKS